MKKHSFWDSYSTWQEADCAWEEKKHTCSSQFPLKEMTSLSSMVPIAEDTKSSLKRKGALWLFRHDSGGVLCRSFLRHPFTYTRRLVQSLFSSHPYIRDGDLFLYGVKSLDQFRSLLQEKNTLLLLGFSYCQKPFECPSGRFSDQCDAACDHPVCSQCCIGKWINTLPHERTVPLIIPTVNFIGRKIFEVQRQYPHHRLIFIITTCEMMLEMVGDFGNMIALQGIGVRLGGRVCNTFQAFEFAESGVKPGLTRVLSETEEKILDLLSLWRRKII